MATTHILISFSLLLLSLHLHCTTVLAQATATAIAPPPEPPGPTNITKILEKGGQYTALIRLLKSTQLGDQINTHLNNSNQGITFFAPTDNAFSSLKSGTLNSLSTQQQVDLLQFHVIPTFLTLSQFQTVSNPLRTQAGDTGPGLFPLNVTTSGNQVNITTGVSNATVANTVYSDDQLGIYQVDTVLLPQKIFDPLPPAPAQPPSPARKRSPASPAGEASDGDAPVDASTAASVAVNGIMVFIGVVASFLL